MLLLWSLEFMNSGRILASKRLVLCPCLVTVEVPQEWVSKATIPRLHSKLYQIFLNFVL